jgi:outer membrane lipase/esterase
VLCITLSPFTAHAAALYAFGDSLSDVGNIYLATNGTEPAPPYASGEFTNGPNWAQDLSARLGLGIVEPSLAGGNDYAYGGATTGYSETLNQPSLMPTLTEQVSSYIAGLGSSTAPSSALYSIWIGSNDIINIFSNGVTNPITAVEGAAQTEAAAIVALANAGAQDFLVPLLTDLGRTPLFTYGGTALSAAGTALALAYNANLQADLASLAATPGIKLSFVDTFSLMDAAVSNPAAFGFTNVTDPCYVGPYTGGGTVCSNPGQYLFWDMLHPTAAAQALIANAAVQTLPEPATLALVGIGLAGFGFTRNRWKAA